jgi:hypothetical protein
LKISLLAPLDNVNACTVGNVKAGTRQQWREQFKLYSLNLGLGS